MTEPESSDTITATAQQSSLGQSVHQSRSMFLWHVRPELRDALESFERSLQAKLEAADAPPFVGLLDVDQEESERMGVLVREALDGDSGKLCALFKKLPIVAIWSISGVLAKSYGKGGAAIYSHIERSLGVSLKAPGLRDNLYSSFVTECRRFGLAYREDARMVDAYLAQAGVAQAQLPEVVKAFCREEGKHGPPPTLSSAALNAWEDDALARLPPGLRVPRMVLETDDTGFHAAMFARWRANQLGTSEFDRRFKEECDKAEKDGCGTKRPPAPRLIWANGSLSMSVPRLDARLHISFDGRHRYLRRGINWPLPQPWPRRIEWDVDSRSGSIDILAGGLPVLAFDQGTGRRLGLTGGMGARIEVDGVDILFVARSLFAIDDQDAVQIGPEGFVAATSIGGSPAVLRIEDREIWIKSRPRPRLRVESGDVATGRQGDLLTLDAVVLVESGRPHAETRIVTVTRSQSTTAREVELNGAGQARIRMSDFEFGDGPPTKVTVGLLPPETNREVSRPRSVASFTAWVWPELERLEDGAVLRTTTVPTSIAWNRCRHIERDAIGRARLDPKGGYPYAIIAFDTDDGPAEFRIPYAGVSITHISANGTARPLPIGSEFVILDSDIDSSIAIASPDPGAMLRVLGREEFRSFEGGARRVLAIRDLSKPSTDNRVILVAGHGVCQTLLTVVPAMAPREVEIWDDGGPVHMSLRLPIAIDAIRLVCEDEMGAIEIAEVALGERAVNMATASWLEAIYLGHEQSSVLLELVPTDFTEGVVFVRVHARALGETEFQPLRSSRGAILALALTASASDAIRYGLDGPNLARRFLSLSRWMSACLSKDSWQQASHVLPERWKSVGAALAATEGGMTTLMEAGLAEPPFDSPERWIPAHHPLQIEPELYGSKAADFAALGQLDDEGAVELARMADLCLDSLPKNAVFSPVVFFGFENARKADKTGERLRSFSIDRYIPALKASDAADPWAGWSWRGEELLGPGHWRAAQRHFRERLEDIDRNRKSQPTIDVMRLIQQELTGAAEENRARKRARDLIGSDRQDLMDRWVAYFLLLFADVCRRREVSDLVDRAAEALGRRRDLLLLDIGLLLRLSPELFAFHLLLSELERCSADAR